MAVKYVRIGKKYYLARDVMRVNAWHASGWTNDQIAKELDITEKEVVDILNRETK